MTEKKEYAKDDNIKAAAEALTTLAGITHLDPTEIEKAIQEAKFRKSHRPKPVDLLDADTYLGPLYSARAAGDNNSTVWAIRLPMMAKLTVTQDDKTGMIYAGPGDYLVHVPGMEGRQIMRADVFQGFYRWTPLGSTPGEDAQPKHTAAEERAAELETNPATNGLAEYARLFQEAWDIPVSCMFQDGVLTVQPPVLDPARVEIIRPPEDPGAAPQYGYTVTRFSNGYVMLNDITGSQYPLLQGMAVDTIPKVLDMIRNNEGLEVFGQFAWSAAAADNFVKKYLQHGHAVMATELKDEWRFAYYILHRMREYQQHPERMDGPERAKVQRPERRRKVAPLKEPEPDSENPLF